MADDTERRTERIPLLMTPSEVQALDDWAFANRIRSRGDAIRRLIETGIKAGGATTKPDPSGGGDDPPSAEEARPLNKPAIIKTTVPQPKKTAPKALPRQ